MSLDPGLSFGTAEVKQVPLPGVTGGGLRQHPGLEPGTALAQ